MKSADITLTRIVYHIHRFSKGIFHILYFTLSLISRAFKQDKSTDIVSYLPLNSFSLPEKEHWGTQYTDCIKNVFHDSIRVRNTSSLSKNDKDTIF